VAEVARTRVVGYALWVYGVMHRKRGGKEARSTEMAIELGISETNRRLFS